MKKMAFIDICNFVNWPTGGMLEYELSILPELTNYYEIDIWGVSVDGLVPPPIYLNGKKYKINCFANVKTKNRIIPNFWKGLSLLLCNAFKEKYYDIIYAHSASCMVSGRIASKNKFAKFVYHQHGLSYKTNYSLRSLTQRPFYFIAQRIADLVFLVSDPISANEHAYYMRNKSKAVFAGIGSPIDLTKFNFNQIKEKIELRKNSRFKNFIFVGRLGAEKNICSMIKAFKCYIDISKNYDAKLHIVGEGPDKENIENEVKNCHIENYVIFHGSIEHAKVYNYLLDSDAFLITSKGEGVSVSVLEAFASGLPVVCYNVAGLKYQNVNNYTGKVVKFGDEKSFAEAIKEIENKRNFFSDNCLNEVQKYNNSLIVDRIRSTIDGMN